MQHALPFILSIWLIIHCCDVLNTALWIPHWGDTKDTYAGQSTTIYHTWNKGIPHRKCARLWFVFFYHVYNSLWIPAVYIPIFSGCFTATVRYSCQYNTSHYMYFTKILLARHGDSYCKDKRAMRLAIFMMRIPKLVKQEFDIETDHWALPIICKIDFVCIKCSLHFIFFLMLHVNAERNNWPLMLTKHPENNLQMVDILHCDISLFKAGS